MALRACRCVEGDPSRFTAKSKKLHIPDAKVPGLGQPPKKLFGRLSLRHIGLLSLSADFVPERYI